MTSILRLLGAAALVVATIAVVGATAGTARAQGATTVSCDILEISASSADKPSIDADLKPLEKKLKKKPFAAWNVFKLLSRTSKELTQSKPETATLTKGKATVLFRDIDTSAKKVRISLTLTTEDEKGKRLADTKVNIDSGDYIVIGRTVANDDGHLLALTCKP